jgi:large subunit ribosomal protein L28
MARICDICGKGPLSGSTISHAHNVNKRKFYPNIHKIKVFNENKEIVRKNICAKCLKAGKIQKA